MDKTTKTLALGGNVFTTIVIIFLAWIVLLDSFYLDQLFTSTKQTAIMVSIGSSGFIFFDHWKQRRGGLEVNRYLITAILSFISSCLLITVPTISTIWAIGSLLFLLVAFTAIYHESADQWKKATIQNKRSTAT